MNVIAYSPFHDGRSADAVGESDRAIASDAAHKPTGLFRRSRVTGFPSWLFTTWRVSQQPCFYESFTPWRVSACTCVRTYAPRMRDIETIDSGLRLVATLRRAARERGEPLPPIAMADALLDERRKLTPPN